MQVVKIFVLVIASALAFVACASHGDSSSSHSVRGSGGIVRDNGDQELSNRSDEALVLRSKLVYSIDPETAQRDAEVCRSWKYNSSSLNEHILAMQQVSDADWGRYCYQYACSVKGEAVLKGRVYRLEVNAGGWISMISPGEKTKYFTSNKRMPDFLASCDCCE